MNRSRFFQASLLALVLLAVGAATVLSQAEKPPVPERRAAAQKLFNEGNWRDAYNAYRELCLDPTNDGAEVGSVDLSLGIQCLHRLGRTHECDEFLESTIAAHPKNWRLLQTAGDQYLNLPHQGFLISGNYERGGHRGGGKVVNSLERDRLRAMQLMTQAMPLASEDDNKHEVSQFYMNLTNQLLYNRGFYEAWRLQYLSNIDELPDLEDGYPYYRNWTARR